MIYYIGEYRVCFVTMHGVHGILKLWLVHPAFRETNNCDWGHLVVLAGNNDAWKGYGGATVYTRREYPPPSPAVNACTIGFDTIGRGRGRAAGGGHISAE